MSYRNTQELEIVSKPYLPKYSLNENKGQVTKNWDCFPISSSPYTDQGRQLSNNELLFERNLKARKHNCYSTISEFCKCHVPSNWLLISANPIES